MSDLLIWFGSGFAFACGLFVGVLVTRLCLRKPKESRDYEEMVNSLLRERNLIGERQQKELGLIAEALNRLCEYHAPPRRPNE